MIIEKRSKNNHLNRINTDAYFDVYKARKELGLSTDIDPKVPHELVGKKVKRVKDNKVYIVESATKCWYAGHYITLLLKDNNDSHCCVYWQNLNCISDIVIKDIKENQLKYKVIK